MKTSHLSVSSHCRRTHDKNGLKGLSMSSQLLIWVIYERENIASLCEFSLQENSYEDMRNIFSLEIMRNSYGNHSWEIRFGHANFFTHGAEWEIMSKTTHMRKWETHFFMRRVRNHAPVGIFLSFLKWWHFSKFENCCLIIFF